MFSFLPGLPELPEILDIGCPAVFPTSLDLIWAEGSIFIMGVEPGIRYWKKFLKFGGFLGFPEATWFTTTPSDHVRSF